MISVILSECYALFVINWTKINFPFSVYWYTAVDWTFDKVRKKDFRSSFTAFFYQARKDFYILTLKNSLCTTEVGKLMGNVNLG